MNNELGAPTVPQEEKPQMSALQRFFGVFFAPAKVFQDINRKPSFILPLVVWIILSLVASAIVLPRIDYEATMQQAIEKSGTELSEQQIEQGASIQKKFGTVFGYAGALLGPILTSLVIAGIFFAVIRIWKAGSTFTKVFGVVAHSFIVQFISTIIFIPMAIRKESFSAQEISDTVKSNLSLFFDRADTSAPLYALASRIDIFSIWTLILIILGLTAVSKLNIRQSATAGIIIWLVYIALNVVLAAVWPS